MQLIVEHQAGLPLLLQPLDGNADDKTYFRQTLQAYLGQLRTTYELDTIVADSALYTAETLPLLQDVHWITRVPATLNAAQEVLRATDPETMTHLDEHTRYQRLSTEYAGVAQRWLVVDSDAAQQRARRPCLGNAGNRRRRIPRRLLNYVGSLSLVPTMPNRRWPPFRTLSP